MKPLFAYGTLRDAAWRKALLGARYSARPALLPGYRRVANASGYLSLRATADPGAAAAGMLIELDAIGWRIADAWEDVAVTYPADEAAHPAGDALAAAVATDVVRYHRIDVVVETAGGLVAATAYICPDDETGAAVTDDRLALRADADVEAAIAAFGATMRAIRERS